MTYEHVKNYRIKLKELLVACKGGCCQLCGYTGPLPVYEFHHVNDKNKEFTVSGSLIANRSRIIAEVKKCALLCANCHREVHVGVKSCKGLELDFDDSKISIFLKEKKYKSCSPCLSCGSPKSDSAKYCSVACYKLHVAEHGKVDMPTAEILAKMVWERPVLQISKTLNVSDAAIWKRCKKHNIDTPPAGYWTHISKGKTREQALLLLAKKKSK